MRTSIFPSSWGWRHTMKSPSSLKHCWLFHDKCNPCGAWISVGMRKQIRGRIASTSECGMCTCLSLSARDATQLSSFLLWGLEMKIPRVLNEISQVAEPAKKRGSYRKQLLSKTEKQNSFHTNSSYLFLCMWVASVHTCAYICIEAYVRVWMHVCMQSPHFYLLK